METYDQKVQRLAEAGRLQGMISNIDCMLSGRLVLASEGSENVLGHNLTHSIPVPEDAFTEAMQAEVCKNLSRMRDAMTQEFDILMGCVGQVQEGGSENFIDGDAAAGGLG